MARRRTATSTRVNFETLIEQLVPALPCDSRAVEGFQAGLEDCVRLRFRLRRSDARFQPAEYMEPHGFAGRRVVQPVASGEYVGLHTQREPEIRLLAAGFTDEAGRCDTDDGQDRFAQGECLAQHVGAAAEASLPVVIADDGIGRVGAVVAGGEYATDRGTDP